MIQPSGFVHAPYYRHSGRFDVGRTAVALLGSVAAALLIATVYTLLVHFLRFWDLLAVLYVICFGLAVGAAAAGFARWANVRNVPLAALLGVVTGAVAIVFSWETWLYGLIQAGGDDVSLWFLLTHPRVVWVVIEKLNATGTFTMRNNTPTGIELWALWIVEAGTVLGCAAAMPVAKVRAAPFCEHCRRWGSTRDLANLAAAGDAAEVRRRMEAGDFAYLQSLGLAGGADQWYAVSFQGCPTCDTTQTLCIEYVKYLVDKQGKSRNKKRSVVRRLRLTPEQTVQVAQTLALMNAPAAESAPAPQAGGVSEEASSSEAGGAAAEPADRSSGGSAAT